METRIAVRNNVRQGDMLFIPVAPEDLKIVATQRNYKRVESGIVAEGEATGHHHRVAEVDMDAAEVYRDWNGDVYMRVAGHSVSIVHEEHGPQILEPGEYKVHKAREFDYMRQLSVSVRD